MTAGHDMVALSVNLNKIALIRNSRPGNFPDVSRYGSMALESGAAGITVHPRPDQRHIKPADVLELSEITSHYPGKEFNIEGNPFAEQEGDYPGFMTLVSTTKPHQCTLVPDSRQQLTSDHGFDLTGDNRSLSHIISALKDNGIRVCLFMDPDTEQISRAADIGADRIELYTGPYALAFLQKNTPIDPVLDVYKLAATHAKKLGLGVNAGHDLNLHNLKRFIEIPELLEVSIGHALTIDALEMGFAKAIKAYNQCLARPLQS